MSDHPMHALGPPGDGPRQCWFDDAEFAEPTLRELLDDPMVRQLMRSDGVEHTDIETLFGALGGFAGLSAPA